MGQGDCDQGYFNPRTVLNKNSDAQEADGFGLFWDSQYFVAVKPDLSGGANIVYFWRLRIHLGKVRFADSVAESARIAGLGWVYKADSGAINSARVGRGGV